VGKTRRGERIAMTGIRKQIAAVTLVALLSAVQVLPPSVFDPSLGQVGASGNPNRVHEDLTGILSATATEFEDAGVDVSPPIDLFAQVRERFGIEWKQNSRLNRTLERVSSFFVYTQHTKSFF
jgi:uncharacterized membrane protein